MVLHSESSHTFPCVLILLFDPFVSHQACPESSRWTGTISSPTPLKVLSRAATLTRRSSCRIPFSYLVQAHNLRYPSPYGKHILSSDVISRSFNPSTNVLKTTKLILKRGKVPRWAPRVIQRIDKTWVLEETEIEMGLVEPDGALLPADGGPDAGGMKRELRTRSRNIDRTEFMEVFEWQVFREKKGDPFSCVRFTSVALCPFADDS